MTTEERELCSNPFAAANFAKAILVEQIMALIGRSSERPNDYRRTLYGFEIATLRRTLLDLTEGTEEFCGTNGDKTKEPLGCGANQTTIAACGDASEIAARVSQGRPSSPAPQLSTVEPSTLPQ